MKDRKTQIVVRLPVDLYDRLKRRAQDNERTVSQEVRLALREWVTRS